MSCHSYLCKKGNIVMRMGVKLKKMNIIKTSLITSNFYRSDLLDVYIARNCKFFIGGNSGLIHYRLYLEGQSFM